MTLSVAAGLDLVQTIGEQDRWLAVLVTNRAGDDRHAPSVSVVNAGVLPHPVTGEQVVGFVARGRTAKLTNLRAEPHAVLVFRAGWEWVAAHGPAELLGPDDRDSGLTDEQLRLLLREVYAAAGGRHDDLDEYDRAMRSEHRTAVLVRPARFTTNPAGTEHQEHG